MTLLARDIAVAAALIAVLWGLTLGLWAIVG